MQDPQSIKFIVVPYHKFKEGIRPGDMRQATTEFGAVRIAQSIASESVIAGVAAYEVLVDNDTGAMNSPRVLFQHGSTPALDE
ncbi:hypothetical protein [Pandoraea sp. NPDC090278]|uniref:hypothetical protein n=1 Tax=Pandoraea sp. NPDC090278 TaxID=3364391 RepID=UPI00383BDF6B